MQAEGGGIDVSDVATITELDELRAEVAALRGRVSDLEATADNKKPILTIDDAARLLCVSAKTIRRRMSEGRLPHFRVGGDKGVRIERAELLKAARAGFPKLRAGRSRLHSKPHFPGSRTDSGRPKEKLPLDTECA